MVLQAYAADLRELLAANAAAAAVVASLRTDAASEAAVAPSGIELARSAKALGHLSGRPLRSLLLQLLEVSGRPRSPPVGLEPWDPPPRPSRGPAPDPFRFQHSGEAS